MPFIGLDLDGVLCSLPGGLNPWIGSGNWRPDPASEERRRRAGLRVWLGEWLSTVRFLGRRPVMDAREALEAIAARRKIVVVTGRPAALTNRIEGWLQQNGLGDLVDLVRANGTGFSSPRFKLEVIRELRVSEFVEDDGRTARFLAHHGIDPIFLVDWPRNRGSYPKQVRIISSLCEVAPLLGDPF